MEEEKEEREVAWIDEPRKITRFLSGVLTPLKEHHTRVENVKGLKTNLYPHQQSIVKAAMDMENSKKHEVMFTEYRKTSALTVNSNAAVLSDAVGSGKTICILALILLQKYPKAFPDITNLRMNLNSENTNFDTIVRRKFNNILGPTIVFAGRSVIHQWIEAVETFTDLEMFVVTNVKELQMMIDMISSKRINKFNIILVKNGKVTRPITFPKGTVKEDKNKMSCSYIYNIISNMRNYCWSRVVVDDFDTIKLPPNAGLVNALFTWYISSTTKEMKTRNMPNRQFRKTSELVLHSDYSYTKLMDNKMLFSVFNIRCDPKYTEKVNTLPATNFWVYRFKSKDDTYKDMLNSLGTEETAEIIEMLNGDAFETAAELAGVKSVSVADIFEQVLGTQFHNYELSIKMLDFIKKNYDSRNRKPMSKNPDPTDNYRKQDLLSCRVPEYNYPGLKAMLDSAKAEFEEMYTSAGIAIERVKSNIIEGECPICMIGFDEVDEDVDAVILKCCGVLVCSDCCFSCIFPEGKLNGQCSNCRTVMGIKNIIYLNSSFNLENITKDRMEYTVEEKEKEKKEEKLPRKKIDAIVDIINGVTPEEQQKADVKIHNLIKGKGSLPELEKRKVLIFSKYAETLNNIEEELRLHDIDFMRLGGTSAEIKRISDKFQDSKEKEVLLISSEQHCSGINLQSASDLIFTHRIKDESVQTQVTGRIKRIGRVSQDNVHFVLYENEFKQMKKEGKIRII